MKRLALFLTGALAFFMAAYALGDTRMFFGGGPAPTPGASERSAIELTLARLDEAMARVYESGDEGPARALLVDPDGEGSPLELWREDLALYRARGAVSRLRLLERQVVAIRLTGLEGVSATAREKWELSGPGSMPQRSEVSARYALRRVGTGLAVAEVAVEP